jgi:hypothetical protein
MQRQRAAAELLVLGDEMTDPVRDPLADRIVDQAQARIGRPFVLTDCRPA